MDQTTAAVLVVEGEMTIYTASETKAQLQAVLLQHSHLEIDLSKVTELDTAGLQLLILAKKSCAQRQGTLRLHGASVAIANIWQKCGLTDFFADTAQSPASAL